MVQLNQLRNILMLKTFLLPGHSHFCVYWMEDSFERKVNINSLIKDLGNILQCKTRCFKSEICFYLPLIFYVFRVTSGQWHPAIAHNLSQMHTLCQYIQWGSYLFLSSFHWGNLRLCIMHVSLVCCVSTLPWDCRETAGFGGGLCLGIFKYKKRCYLILRESWLKLNSTFWISLLLFYDTFFFFNQLCCFLLMEIVSCWQAIIRQF